MTVYVSQRNCFPNISTPEWTMGHLGHINRWVSWVMGHWVTESLDYRVMCPMGPHKSMGHGSQPIYNI